MPDYPVQGPRLDTYRSMEEADRDEERVSRLATALGVTQRRVRRDECGMWCILGRGEPLGEEGKAFSTEAAYYYRVEKRTKRAWAFAKKKLAFMELVNDGDEAGVFRMNVLPTEEDASVIREVCGFPKRKDVHPEVMIAVRRALERRSNR